MFLKNTASQFLYFTMISSADGSALTSAAGGYRTIDGGSQNAVTGSLSHKGNGQWELALSQADINGDNIGFLFTHATGVNVSMHINTTVKSIDTLQDITAANVRTQCDNALTAFGPNTVAPNTVVPDIAGTAATLHGVTDGKIDAAQGDLDTITDVGVTAVTVSDKTGYGLSTAGILAIWHQLVASVATASTMGKLIVDYLNAAITSRAATGAQMTLENNAITAAKYDKSTAFPVVSVDSGSTRIARTGADVDTLKTLSDQLDTSGAVAGAGAITFTYTLTNSEDDLPIADADFWVTSDLAGANVIASGKTDQYGKVTFYLDAGTVYVWRQKSGWDFTNPDIEIVA